MICFTPILSASPFREDYWPCQIEALTFHPKNVLTNTLPPPSSQLATIISALSLLPGAKLNDPPPQRNYFIKKEREVKVLKYFTLLLVG